MATAARTVERDLPDSFVDCSPEVRRSEIGRWSEAGRLAAETGNAATVRRVVREAQKSKDYEAIASEIEQLQSPDRQQDLRAASETFSQIARNLGG